MQEILHDMNFSSDRGPVYRIPEAFWALDLRSKHQVSVNNGGTYVWRLEAWTHRPEAEWSLRGLRPPGTEASQVGHTGTEFCS